jgi:hypothetical protein
MFLRCRVGGDFGDVRGIEGTMPPLLDADFWRKRAEKARAAAEAMSAHAAKREMQQIAAVYDQIADHIKRTARRRATHPSD